MPTYWITQSELDKNKPTKKKKEAKTVKAKPVDSETADAGAAKEEKQQ